MFDANNPVRSMLFTPAAKPRALAKIGDLRCDGVIVDLEDAVGAADKQTARKNLIQFANHRTNDAKTILVRVNAVTSDLFADDVAAAVQAGVDGVVLPKVNGAADLVQLQEVLANAEAPNLPIWAMIETPRGVMNLQQICTATPRLAGLILGPNDLTKELAAVSTPDREALAYSIGALVLAARAFGLICLDGVYNAFRDEDGFLAECQQGHRHGFDGKTLIHPGQIDGANRIFAPSAEDVDRARRMIACFTEAQASGAALATFEGEMIEELHVHTARALIEKYNKISELNELGAKK